MPAVAAEAAAAVRLQLPEVAAELLEAEHKAAAAGRRLAAAHNQAAAAGRSKLAAAQLDQHSGLSQTPGLDT